MINVGWRDRMLLRRYGQRAGGGQATLLDREATEDDLADLRSFVDAHAGVEFYVEPETTATDTTVVAIDRDGAWIRRRVGSAAVARRLAASLRTPVPVYEATVAGYPRRMREWNRRNSNRNINNA
jgi:hypothetical protein